MCYRCQLIHTVELRTARCRQVVADEDQCQVGIGKQALFHKVGVFLIQRTGALVYQQDGAIVNQGTGNGDTLLLTAGKITAILTYNGVKAIGHGGQICGKGTALNGRMQLLFREIFTQCDVLPNRSIEQEHILLNVTHLLLELSGCNGVNVHIVKRNRTGVVRQPAQKQLEQSGFSTAGGSCQGILFALFKVEGGIFQDGLFLIIAERNSIYRNGGFQR